MNFPESPNDAQAVSNFYASIREYWAALSSSAAGQKSGMLNFGCWDSGVQDLFQAQGRFCQRLIERLPHRLDGLSGLEIGCGIGGISVHMLHAVPGVRMTGLDISVEQLAIAAAHAQAGGCAERVEWREGSSMDMPFPDAAFDFTLCIESSFHYPDKPAFFAENARVLKPGGIALVADITCEDVARIKWRRGNHFEGRQRYLEWAVEAGFDVVGEDSIGVQVYRPLSDFIDAFNRRRRSPIGKYWSMVLHNYAELSAAGVMDYRIFALRKPQR